MIHIYTGNSPENKLTNNLLRASRNPSEIYYCQPYFRQLYKAIWELYQKQELSELVCYRGANASQEEIQNYKKNVGEIIQNLGFLSTTIDKETAENFAGNLIFVINVKQESRDIELDYGFADIT